MKKNKHIDVYSKLVYAKFKSRLNVLRKGLTKKENILKRVTIKDIAKECGVSTTTVSRVLNNKVGCCSPETEKRILEAVAKTNFRPNPAARAMVTKKTNIIGVILPDIYNYYFQDLFKGAENYLSENGYSLILCNTDGNPKKEREFLLSLSQGMVDGIIVTTANRAENNKVILELTAKGMPVVTVERYGKDLADIPKVCFDNKNAMVQAVEVLYNNGHRRIAFLQGPSEAYNAKLRYEGYQEGLRKVGISLDETLVVQGDYKMDSGEHITQVLLQRTEFTAIIASNDLMALGACKAIRKAGRSVPEDISVIGFDGTLLAEMHQPPLATIVLHGYDMGSASAENLLCMINKKGDVEKEILFMPELRMGNSIRNLNN